jgi:hypothetical protein
MEVEGFKGRDRIEGMIWRFCMRAVNARNKGNK